LLPTSIKYLIGIGFIAESKTPTLEKIGSPSIENSSPVSLRHDEILIISYENRRLQSAPSFS